MIWNVADLLRGPFKPHEYGLVILPMTVVKRFHDCLLPTHQKVLDTYEKVKKLAVTDGFLRTASGYQFYNTSKFTFQRLLADPDNVESNFSDYLNGFSANVQDVLAKFDFDNIIKRMVESNTLYLVIKEFAVNGIPVFAFELKNQFTGQSVENAKKQWKSDRDPREICFQFNKRILAFFCVDLSEAWMTTKLAGDKTYFLPFNQGSNGAGNDGGKGNPANDDGYPTDYLWKNVFQADSMMDIIQKFISLEGDRLIFPRFHQLDVVRKLIADVKANGPGKNYLIQHSAGSGKSNSIAWTTYRLALLHDDNNKAIFSSVIVVTDRTVLDAQLQATISGFDHTLGSVETIGEGKNSQDLKQAINDGVRIIVTTLQKFAVIYEEVDAANGRNYAVICDEAHSSQTGSSAQKLKTALADLRDALKEYAEIEGIVEDKVEPQDKLVKELITHGKHKNLSFFAFTATPKDTTLEMFGTQDETGQFHPFHIYSMHQAIEEGFILDVLQNYMTCKTCFKIANSTPENPEVPASRASKAIKKYQQLYPENIRQKSEIIVETFMTTTRAKINGNAKMMVVTASRPAAVLYFKEINGDRKS